MSVPSLRGGAGDGLLLISLVDLWGGGGVLATVAFPIVFLWQLLQLYLFTRLITLLPALLAAGGAGRGWVCC